MGRGRGVLGGRRGGESRGRGGRSSWGVEGGGNVGLNVVGEGDIEVELAPDEKNR